jgi:hypothetical protein
MGLARIELATSRLSGVRSNQLSYRPVFVSQGVTLFYSQKQGGKRGEKAARGMSVLTLRKEVIQPHLPVRLPCYDFTPLTRRTFGTAPLVKG